MPDTPDLEPTPDQVRAVLAQLVAYADQWAAQNNEAAGLYFGAEDRDHALQLAAAETKAARLVEDLATNLDDRGDRVCIGADERFNGGRVSLLPGRHPLVAVLGQLAAGETPAAVAYDFDLTEAQVSVLQRLLDDVLEPQSDTTATGRTQP